MYVNSEILEWFPDENYMDQEKLGYLLSLSRNTLNGLTVHPDPDMIGFSYKDDNNSFMSQYTHYAIYRQQNGGWCAVECIPDTLKGIDIEDERYLVKNKSISRCVAAIKAHQITYAPDLYQRVIEVSEGVMRKWARV